jgi:hypothetical protein
MSSPLTSLSSLDDDGDELQDRGSAEETDDLKVAEVHGLIFHFRRLTYSYLCI